MRFMALGAAVVVVLGSGLAGPVGDGPAPGAVAYASGSPVPMDKVVLPVPSEDPMPDLEAVLVVDGLDQPTSAVAAPDGRLFVVEKPGLIRVVDGGRVLDDPLLDLDAAIPDSRIEQGLLSMALHPDFGSNGRFFVDFTDGEGDVRVVEYRVAEEDAVADPRTARSIIHVSQPGQFHNGGHLQFGPDGFLYASFGDGHFGESQLNAQRRENVLGSIIRVDIDSGDPYAVPVDNPFVGTRYAPEIWLYGIRNPWRFWIDHPSGTLVVGDVGQFTWEEITVLGLDQGGLNLGWPGVEGTHCYDPPDCDRSGTVLPVIEYDHAEGCAVIGGPVYRGSLVPELYGMVVYSDFCTGFVRAFGLRGGHVVRTEELIEPGEHGPVLSLAVDAEGEILLLTQLGEIRRLEPAG